MLTPKIGEDFKFDDNIFQRGWFNHQLASFLGSILIFRGEMIWIEFHQEMFGEKWF